MMIRRFVAAIFVFGALLSQTSAVSAVTCPFCDAPSLMMSELVAQNDHLLLGRWEGGTKPSDIGTGSARFTVAAVGKSFQNRYKIGDPLELPQYVAGNKEAEYLLMGPDDGFTNWASPQEISAGAWKYLSELPPPVKGVEQQAARLAKFIPYLEHPDLVVANDAYGEFAVAPYAAVVLLRDQLPREKIREWVVSRSTSPNRMGLYGLLLGLCGNDEDAAAMEDKILHPDADLRIGIEGVMFGYVLIRGEPGIAFLEEHKMRAQTYTTVDGETKKLPFAETYATMTTLRHLWSEEPDLFPRERLKQSMRILLSRRDMADLVIADLARWKDWGIQDQLMAMYDDEKFNLPSIKRQIVRFLFNCSEDVPRNADGTPGEIPEYAQTALKNLAVLEEKDPKTVLNAKRYLIR